MKTAERTDHSGNTEGSYAPSSSGSESRDNPITIRAEANSSSGWRAVRCCRGFSAGFWRCCPASWHIESVSHRAPPPQSAGFQQPFPGHFPRSSIRGITTIIVVADSNYGMARILSSQPGSLDNTFTGNFFRSEASKIGAANPA